MEREQNIYSAEPKIIYTEDRQELELNTWELDTWTEQKQQTHGLAIH